MFKCLVTIYIYRAREWMYNRVDEVTGEIKKEYKEGLTGFMQFATNQEISREQGKMSCPCSKCDNEKFINIETVWKHLFWKGFTPGYYIWFSHGEDFGTLPSTSHVNIGDIKLRKQERYDDRGERRIYPTPVPDIFSEIGRLSGKKKSVWLTDQEFDHIHNYILRNCDNIRPYERYWFLFS